MSDWGATHSTVLAANSGLDMQMPDDSYFGAALKAAVAAGQVSEARINGTSFPSSFLLYIRHGIPYSHSNVRCWSFRSTKQWQFECQCHF